MLKIWKDRKTKGQPSLGNPAEPNLINLTYQSLALWGIWVNPLTLRDPQHVLVEPQTEF